MQQMKSGSAQSFLSQSFIKYRSELNQHDSQAESIFISWSMVAPTIFLPYYVYFRKGKENKQRAIGHNKRSEILFHNCPECWNLIITMKCQGDQRSPRNIATKLKSTWFSPYIYFSPCGQIFSSLSHCGHTATTERAWRGNQGAHRPACSHSFIQKTWTRH